jgi:hypothetical protein
LIEQNNNDKKKKEKENLTRQNNKLYIERVSNNFYSAAVTGVSFGGDKTSCC